MAQPPHHHKSALFLMEIRMKTDQFHTIRIPKLQSLNPEPLNPKTLHPGKPTLGLRPGSFNPKPQTLPHFKGLPSFLLNPNPSSKTWVSKSSY